MTGFFTSKDIVDIEDIVAIFVVIPIILDSLAWLCQHTSGVPRGLVVKSGVADSIGGGKVGCQRLKRLKELVQVITIPVG
jgi:hypothetical protein